MSDQVTLQIDGETVTVDAGTTILDAAASIGKQIPVICYHEATTANGLCRMCVVDVNGGRVLQAACIAECSDGAVVETRSERVERSRRTILEMLDASVNLDEAPELQAMMADYGVDHARFPAAETREHPLHDDNSFYVRDYSQCVLCWRCVQVCADDAQYTFALTLAGRGYHTTVSTAFDVGIPDSPCVYCGQCIGVCPTGALKPKVEYGLMAGWSPEQIRQSSKTRRRKS